MATTPTLGGRVLLMTASAVLYHPKQPSKRQEVIVFFDTGAHRSYVSHEIAEKLQLEVEHESDASICTFGADEPIPIRRQTTAAHIHCRNGKLLLLQLDLTENIIPIKVPMAIVSDLSNYELDNKGSFVDAATCDRRPDLLIGMDQQHLFQIITEKQLGNGYYLSQSVLGPIVSGLGSVPLKNAEIGMTVSSLAVGTPTEKHDELFGLVQQYYELEKSCLEEADIEDNEAQIVKKFNESLKIVEGRYEVTLPWKKPMPSLNSNYWLARGRLRSTMKMLRQKPALLDQYNQIMTEQLEKGIIEVVPPKEVDQGSIIHYLPHQAVVREDKLHTKLRIVYDGSAKTGRNNASINQCLHRGPVLLSDLVGILLRFRLPEICIVADIEKAFLQLSVTPADRDTCRFLWPSDPHEENWERQINTYRFRRVTFGLICSPFLLAATIREHLRRENSALARNIHDNIYVDNVIIHASTNDDVLSLCNKSREIYSRASMNLREFASNDREAILKLPEANRILKTEVKVLGLRWNTEKDVLRIFPKIGTDNVWTKRRVLTLIASVFDPLGLLTPAMLHSKLFFQSLWKQELSWDEPLSDNLSQKFLGTIASWNTEISVPRRIFDTENDQYELHIFSDASGTAFGAAAYLRTIGDDSPRTQLIFSKSRVKSIGGSTTIPRLELQALALAAKVSNFLKNLVPVNKICLWTDSQCVIHWLNATTKLERFVENRVKTIRNYTVGYVTSEENPADLLTRGIDLDNLSACTKWWTGPSWLCESEYTAVKNAPSFDPEEYAKREAERLPEPIQSLCLAVDSENSIFSLERFSSWRTAVRVTAYVLRFVNIIKKQSPRTVSLTASDLAKARTILLREAQCRQPPTNDTQKSLALYLDDNNIWRCQGRIDESHATTEAKRPIWLPPQDPIIDLIIQEVHESANHAGTTITLAHLRQQYWLSQGRRRIRNSIRKQCFKCRKFLISPYKLPNMPNLPESRVIRSRPFENTGLDYFGPITVKPEKESKPKKIWVCIFTCFVTRAIHLEIAFDLSAESFIDAFRRFIARRGTPRTITSDNGTNFKLSAKIVSQSWTEVTTSVNTQSFASDQGITWNFITERAPWRGGLWERLIHIIKGCLKRTVGRKILRIDEFFTLLAEVEMTVNLRPLTYLSEADQTLPLRPVDFLLPYGIRSDVPITDNEDVHDPDYHAQASTRYNLVHTFNCALQRIETFWHLWRSEYLLSLRERQKSLEFPQDKTSLFPPRVGEVVLVMDDDVPRNTWRLAIIEELIIGRDGAIRTARIRNGKRTTTRAINVLYPLEVTDKELQITDSETIIKEKDSNEVSLISLATLGQYIPYKNFSQIENHTLLSFSTMDDGNEVILGISDSEMENDENEKPENPPTRSKEAARSTQAHEKRLKIKKAVVPTIKRAAAPTSKKAVVPTIKRAAVPITSEKILKPSLVNEAAMPKKHNQNTTLSYLHSTMSVKNESRVIATKNSYWKLDNSSAGWALLRHEHCRLLTVSDIANSFNDSAIIEFAGKVSLKVPTLIQAIYVRWALQHAIYDDRRENIRYYVENVCSCQPEEVIKIHRMRSMYIIRNDRKPVDTCDNRNLKQTIAIWRKVCRVADMIYSVDPWKAVISDETFDHIDDIVLRSTLQKENEKFCRALSLSRRDAFFPQSTVIRSKTVLIGDDLISGATFHLPGIYHLHTEVQNTAETIKNLYFLAEVENIIVCTGLDVVRGVSSSDSLRNNIIAVDEYAARYQHIRWLVVSPPLVANDAQRSCRIHNAVEKQWRHLEVVTGPGRAGLWGRLFDRSDTPSAEQYTTVFRELTRRGIPLLSTEQMEVTRDPSIGNPFKTDVWRFQSRRGVSRTPRKEKINI